MIKIRLVLSVITFILACPSYAQNTDKLQKSSIVVDTHNDFLSKAVEHGYQFDKHLSGITQSDIFRMDSGKIDI